MGNWNY